MAVVVPGNFIFLANPHTASLATADALAEVEGAVRVAPHHTSVERLLKFGEVKKTSWDAPKIKASEVIQGDELPVATVRNPYDWLVTCWLRRRESMGNLNFYDYCGILNERSPGAFMKGDRIQFHQATRLLRYERLAEDLREFLRERGIIESIELKTRNVTADKRSWESYYDRLTYNIVNRRFERDFERLGYPMR